MCCAKNVRKIENGFRKKAGDGRGRKRKKEEVVESKVKEGAAIQNEIEILLGKKVTFETWQKKSFV